VNLKGVLDRIPAVVLHGLLLFVGSILTWAAVAAQGVAVNGNPVATAVVSAAAVSLVGSITLWWTNLTKQYGVGSE